MQIMNNGAKLAVTPASNDNGTFPLLLWSFCRGRVCKESMTRHTRWLLVWTQQAKVPAALAAVDPVLLPDVHHYERSEPAMQLSVCPRSLMRHFHG